jgi:hypothetical protein
MPEDRDDTLGQAMDEARRQAQDDQRWKNHLELHDLAARLRSEDVERRWKAHGDLHEAAHVAHAREHDLEATARDKAETGIDKRLEGMNEVRSQLKEQALTFARVETVNSLTDRVIAIEKLDIKGEGRALGQGATVGIIVGAIGLVGTILGIVIVAANFLSAAP